MMRRRVFHETCITHTSHMPEAPSPLYTPRGRVNMQAQLQVALLCGSTRRLAVHRCAIDISIVLRQLLQC